MRELRNKQLKNLKCERENEKELKNIQNWRQNY